MMDVWSLEGCRRSHEVPRLHHGGGSNNWGELKMFDLFNDPSRTCYVPFNFELRLHMLHATYRIESSLYGY